MSVVNKMIDNRAINSLMSPPEAAPLESFARASAGPSAEMQSKPTYPAALSQFPSPPVSPYAINSGPEIDRSLPIQDPILYPSQDSSVNAPAQSPLFTEDDDTITAQLVVDKHMAARKSSVVKYRDASPPRRDDYLLALTFKSQVFRKCQKNPKLWAAREKRILLEDRALRMGQQKPRPSPGKKFVESNSPRPIRPNHGGRNPPTTSDTVLKPSRKPAKPTAEPKAPRMATTREDKDFTELPDYAPPISSLPNKPNSLKVDWKGAPVDLRNDPHRHLLHDDEALLAGNLRLDCATYLTSKRRIFIARIEAMKIPKEFRKTDAQQACKIDVNKASKLWSAYEKVGWLDAKWFTKYL
jgi:hypothetical protein